jgi:stalled ribosome rescue protein Dom34
LNPQLKKEHTMSHYHAVVWLDHAQAHVMHISPDDVEKSVVHPAKAHLHLHHKSGTMGSGKAPEDQHYYHAVIEALAGAQEILVVGPGQAKLQLIKHVHAHDPAVSNKIVGVETVDHPTDGQLVAYARKYFDAKDRML